MTSTTLTREALLEKAKPKYEVVEVPGYGSVGIRTQSEVKRSRRASNHFDDKGKFLQEVADRQRAYKIIDQLMIDENTPMFSDADVDAIAESNGAVWDAFILAINVFNGEFDPENETEKKMDESND